MKNKSGKGSKEEGDVGLGGFIGGLGTLLERLAELAEKGEQLQKSGEFTDTRGKLRGVFGLTIKTGLGGDEGVKVEPFGNVHEDERTGQPVVSEVREPMVDVFEEENHVLVVAELPGVSAEDVQVELHDDILTIAAARGDKKYRKEVLLPAAFAADKMTSTCRNGVLEVRLVH